MAGVKRLVADMREQVKAVSSHREKCCMVLSAAMAASVALDQVRPSPTRCRRQPLLHAHAHILVRMGRPALLARSSAVTKRLLKLMFCCHIQRLIQGCSRLVCCGLT